jgi:hypothetical protein
MFLKHNAKFYLNIIHPPKYYSNLRRLNLGVAMGFGLRPLDLSQYTN